MYDRICNLGKYHWLLEDFATGKERAILRTFEQWCYFYPRNCHAKYLRFRINQMGATFVTVVRYGSDRKNAERFYNTSIKDACRDLLQWLRNNNYTDEELPKV